MIEVRLAQGSKHSLPEYTRVYLRGNEVGFSLPVEMSVRGILF